LLIGSQPLLFDAPIVISEELADLAVEVAVVWTTGPNTVMVSFSNGTPTTGGGMHVEGFKKALTQTVNTYGRAHDSSASWVRDLSGEDIREGMTAVLRFECRDPEILTSNDHGQPGNKLASLEARAFSERATRTQLAKWLDHHPMESVKLIDKSRAAAEARVESLRERDLKRRQPL
jgi:DNA gyrase subunit B